MKKIFLMIMILIGSLTIVACGEKYEYVDNKINITTTTNVMGDLAKTIGGDKVAVWSLMGAGIDPHTYIARPSDLNAMDKADYILVSGLHLEGKMVDAIDGYSSDKTVFKLGNEVLMSANDELKNRFIVDATFGDSYDPHFWFDIPLYIEGVKLFTASLVEDYPEHKNYFESNMDKFLNDLNTLELWIQGEVAKIPEDNKVLVSAHDAFEYFGKEFGFQVEALQGLSTEDEVTMETTKEVIRLVIDNNVKAIFPETSVPRETIEAVLDGVKEEEPNHEVVIGNNLYSDSLGDSDDDNTYLKMYRKNVTAIVEGLTN